jgi:ABC-2 type transport system permease protein
MAMLTTFLPAFLLSGFMFSIQAMPARCSSSRTLIPARYFLEVTRGIFLKGVGIHVLAWPAPHGPLRHRGLGARHPRLQEAAHVKPPRSVERILEVVRKELLQLKRDPRLRRVIFVAPIIQLTVFGYAVSTDVRRTPLFLVDHDKSRASRDLVEAMTASDYFRVIGRSDRPADLVSALDHGRATVGLEIPPDFESDLRALAGAKVQILVDGTNSNVGTVALGQAETIYQEFVARETGASPASVIDLRERAWYNADLESRNYNVPAVVGQLVLLICLSLTSLAVVREREIGTLEQLMVSPLKPTELIIGKALPFSAIGLVVLSLVTTVAILWFRIPFRGNFFVLLLASVLYILSALGIGLFVSTVSRTQQEAFMTTFLFFMPILLLSGFMFPITSMPMPIQYLTLLNPVRHFLEIVRAIFLKGAGLDILWPQYVALLVLGLAILRFAASRFHKRLD